MKSCAIACLIGLRVATACAQSPVTSLISGLPPLGPVPDLYDVYAELTGRTLLMSGALPAMQSQLPSDLAGDTNRAAAFIEAAFAREGIEVVRDGNKFLQLQRFDWRKRALAAPLARIPPPIPGGDVMRKGSINWSGAEVYHVLATYSQLTGRTVLRPMYMACALIRFRNQQPLTRAEMLYAIKVVLALNNVTLVDDGDKFAHALHSPQTLPTRFRAPKAAPGASLIDPRDVPVFKVVSQPPAKPAPSTTRVGRVLDKLKQLYLWARTAVFGSPPSPPRPDVNRILALYARLTGNKPVPSNSFGHLPVYLEIKTAVTKTELLYAIEATLAQSGLAITTADNHSVQIIPIPDSPQANAVHPAASKP